MSCDSMGLDGFRDGCGKAILAYKRDSQVSGVLHILAVTLWEPHIAETAVFQTSLTLLPSFQMEIWSPTMILIPDGSVVPDSVMLPLLPVLLLLPGLTRAGLLGAGTGLGSCAAPPFR